MIKKIMNKFKNIDISWDYKVNKDNISLKPNAPIENNEYFNSLLSILSVDKINNSLIIPLEELYELYYNSESNFELIDDYKLFNLPSIFEGEIYITNKGNYYQDEKVEYVYHIKDVDGYYEMMNNAVIFSQVSENYYVLPANISKFLEYLNFYNKNNSNDLSCQFEMLSKIKEIQLENNSNMKIILSDRLNKEEHPVIIDKNIELDFNDNGDVMEVFPILSNNRVLNNQLLEQIYNSDKVEDVYHTDDNGVRTRFAVKNKEAIKKLKKYRYTSGEDRYDMLLGKSELFNNPESTNDEGEDEVFDLSKFGPRVNGIGYFTYRPIPSSKSNTKDINWRDDEYLSIIGMDSNGESKVKFLEPKHLKILNNALESVENNKRIEVELDIEDKPFKLILTKEQIENEIENINSFITEIDNINDVNNLEKIALSYEKYKNEEFIRFKNRYIKNEPLEKIIDRIEYLNRNKKEKKKNLLISDNFYEVEYDESIISNNLYKEAIIPKSLKDSIELFDYQKECLCKLQNLYKASKVNGFMLCDDMGLGKTLQLLSFLAWIKETDDNIDGPALIVAPKILLKNWDSNIKESVEEGEIQKFFKENTFKTIHINGRSDISPDKLKEFDIVFITYDSLVSNENSFGRVKWNVVICDEAQFIKSPSIKRTHAVKAQNANFKIACSATPIENTLCDLWSLVDFCKPGLLGSLSEFNKKYQNKDRSQKESINAELSNKLVDFYIRREKDILPKALKPKNIKIIKTKPNNLEKNIISNISKSNFNISSIQKLLQSSSILEFVNNKNASLTKEDLNYILNNSSKLKLLKEILEDISSKREKVLIFTNYHKTQQLLVYAIKHWFNINPIVLNGKEKNYNKRYIELSNFKSKKGFDVAILSPLVAGFGITINEANHIIHYDRMWNPAKEDQATDRAYRIGQDKDVTVYYPMLSMTESSIRTYTDITEFIKENSIKSPGILFSPEEKLNLIIARKKDMLINFFLAFYDSDEDFCKEFNDIK